MSATSHRPPLIRLDRIVKQYGASTVLDNVNLDIHAGEFLALLGPSGCGKTTLLRTIAGFVTPTSGDLTIDSRSVLADPPHRRPVNTVFQNYALFPHMTVNNNVAFGLRRLGIRGVELDEQVMNALVLVGMEKFADRYPAQLSGGQQQRVALARAVVNRPKVLLLDEPLAALDLKLRKRMQLELKRLHERLGMTFVIVTHDQEEALVMADRIVVMSNGRIEQVGTGEDIYDNPASRFVADFIGEANLIACRVDASGVLRTHRGDVVLPYGTTSPREQDVTLMVRPERIQVVEGTRNPDLLHFTGIVRDVVYAGPITRIYVSCDIADEIVVSHKSTQRQFSIGESLPFAWSSSDARILTH
ncbi:Fe3+/spermidine/putrescine ABC transporter ATP-binding protein [Pandoraea eparura]|uniref:Spermidine/putrescine import ATP-binding protein PotA n=1 Tax=Pandoraea eparura TaxID=2508291 RepID=A0A5E4RBJ5_9BURK|nr:ABC transporter ATP-binding protein [Pandoraea eparura]VVD60746.1 Fe3+/spermidine/putrescine ABC transporter ATP-binding protein [Pandoraea eparura]